MFLGLMPAVRAADLVATADHRAVAATGAFAARCVIVLGILAGTTAPTAITMPAVAVVLVVTLVVMTLTLLGAGQSALGTFRDVEVGVEMREVE